MEFCFNVMKIKKTLEVLDISGSNCVGGGGGNKIKISVR